MVNRIFALGACLILFFAGNLYAQSVNASLTGRVTDSSNAIVQGAKVTVNNTETNVRYDRATNDTGNYYFPDLPPGIYSIQVEMPGFKTTRQVGVILHVQDAVELDFELKPGNVSETVTVSGETPLVNTTDATVSSVIERNFIENIPLNGRSFQSLIDLTPGMTTTKTSVNSPGQFSANGQRTDANYFTIDGVSANIGVSAGGSLALGETGGGALPAFSSTGGTNNLVSVDALQEFKIQTSNAAPEFGRQPGAQVSILTRSGTNAFHGTLFDYLRNEVLDANDWFANRQGNPRPAEKQNDFGGVFGGPIIKDKTFFFFSYEGLRLRVPETRSENVPSLAARAAASPAVQPIFNAFPKPNGASNGLSALFTATFSNPSTLNATSIRIDHTLTDKIHIFGRYNYAPSSGTQRGAFNYYTLSTFNRAIANTQTLTLGATLLIRQDLVNDFRFNWSRAEGASQTTGDTFGGAVVPSADALFNPHTGGSVKTDLGGFFFNPDSNGYLVGNGVTNFQRQFNVVDQVSLARGTHAFKFGVDYRRLRPSNGNHPYEIVTGFDGFAPAAASSPIAGFAYVASVNSANMDIHYLEFALFAQDTWRITPRLTLTYGVRWDYNPPPSSSPHMFTATNLDDPASVALAPAGTPLYHATKANFAPRLGVAYKVGGRSGFETIFRGGFGTFYDLGNAFTGDGARGFPYLGSQFISYPGLTYPITPAQAAPIVTSLTPPYVGEVTAFEPNLKLPRTYQWNATLEQSLGSGQALSATYVGAVARDLLRQTVLTSAVGLNPDFSNPVTVVRGDATSSYNALQVQFRKRLLHGVQATASYTFSHAIDEVSNDVSDTPFFKIYDIRQDRGNSDFDIRHAVSGAITYQVPSWNKNAIVRSTLGNWAVDTLFTARTATPVNLYTGVDAFQLNETNHITDQRPNVVPGVPWYISDPNVAGGRVINEAAFAYPPPGPVQGNFPRNALRGFGVAQVDLALRREFHIKENVSLRLRVEFFNVFNHPNFGDPGAQNSDTNTLGSPQFGQSTSSLASSLGSGGADGGFSPIYQTGGPRSGQVALKLIF